MTVQSRMKHRHLLVLLLAAAMIPACGGEECGPGCRRPEPTLENIWPNLDGTYWTYEYAWRAWDADVHYYEEEDSLPPLPSLDEIEELIRHHPTGPDPQTANGVYKLEFKGQTTTGPGVTAQYLEESLVTARGGHLSTAGGMPHSGLLGRIRLARPDLRARIDALAPADVSRPLRPGGESAGYLESGECLLVGRLDGAPLPNMIHGGAWEKTTEWIGTYGELDTLLAWKFLEADLDRDHEFTHQLVPSLADDVFLHCRVLGKSVFRTPAGDFWRAFECMYLVDYGPAAVNPPGGDGQWQHFFDYGRVIYVPDLGPVYSYERALVAVGRTTGTGYGDITIELTGTNLEVE
jgi:hypothetical protein